MFCPPITEAGLNVSDFGVGALTVMPAVVLFVPTAALIVATVLAATGVVEIVNWADVAVALTVTEAGATAQGWFDEIVTTWPPANAGEANVIVPVDVPPPITLLGLIAIDFTDWPIPRHGSTNRQSRGRNRRFWPVRSNGSTLRKRRNLGQRPYVIRTPSYVHIVRRQRDIPRWRC
jgi:hypothetical protein